MNSAPALRPTIKDVARAAGVHFTTVSIALRGNSRIPPATRDRIIATAMELGYRRDDVSTALARRRNAVERDRESAPTIGYVTNRSEVNGLFRQANQQRLFAGAQRQAQVLGYRLEVISVDTGAYSSDSLQEYLRRQRITGIILGSFEPGRAAPEFNFGDLCAVSIDSRHIQGPAQSVSHDRLRAVETAFHQLTTKGYRRIGLAIAQLDEEATDRMHMSGYLLAQSRVSAPSRLPALLFPTEAVSEAVITRLLRTWIREHAIDAVLCNWTNIRKLVRQSGYRVPGEVGCACLCLSRRLPGMAGVVAEMEMVGAKALSQVISLMHRQDRAYQLVPTSVFVEGHWVDGASAPARHF